MNDGRGRWLPAGFGYLLTSQVPELILVHDLTSQNVKSLIFQPINRHRGQIALQTGVTDRELHSFRSSALCSPARARSIFRCR